MIVQKDIALKLGISRATVSLILSGGENASRFRPELRKRVLDAAREMSYQHNELARAVRTGRNYTVGFVTQRLSDEYSGILFDGVVDVLTEESYSTRIFTLREERDASAVAARIIRSRLEGVICYNIPQPEFVRSLSGLLARCGIPMVLAGGSVSLEGGIRVLADTVQGGRLAFRHLGSLGHRRIVLALSYQWAGYSRNLLRGFQEAAGEAEGPVRLFPLGSDGHLDEALVLESVRRERATACFCNNSYAALDLITRLQGRGVRIPEELSVMGRGDMRFCRSCHPGITVLDESLYSIGKRSAEMLLSAIGGKAGADLEERIPHGLVVRESTGPAEGTQPEQGQPEKGQPETPCGSP